jgi:hypothetical protein
VIVMSVIMAGAVRNRRTEAGADQVLRAPASPNCPIAP